MAAATLRSSATIPPEPTPPVATETASAPALVAWENASSDASLRRAHDLACRDRIPSEFRAEDLPSGDPVLVVEAQLRDRPYHLYSDGLVTIACVGRPGDLPIMSSVDWREREPAGRRPGLVVPEGGVHFPQGPWEAWWGTVDPIVSGVRAGAPGIGEVAATVAGGFFIVQWDGEATDDPTFTPFDSCGNTIPEITLAGGPTPCPPP